jgi:hypothetical protein
MPKYISLAAAHSILENCIAVLWDDRAVSLPAVSDLEDEDSNESFLMLESAEDDGSIVGARFIQNENARVRVEGDSMFLMDDTGEEVKITILNPNETTFNGCENIGLHEVW